MKAIKKEFSLLIKLFFYSSTMLLKFHFTIPLRLLINITSQPFLVKQFFDRGLNLHQFLFQIGPCQY
jgi:hypothetical protein